MNTAKNKLGSFNCLVGVCGSGLFGEYKQRPQVQISDASTLHLKPNYVPPAAVGNQNNAAGVERIEAYLEHLLVLVMFFFDLFWVRKP